MKNSIVITMVYIFISILFLVIVSLFGVRRVLDSASYTQTRISTLPYSQLIKVNNNGFNVILIYLKNNMALDINPIRFTVSDISGKVLRQIDINGRNVGDGENIRFQFEPIFDSGNQAYRVSLSGNIGIGISDSGMAYQVYYQPLDKIKLLSGIFESIIYKLFSFRYLTVLLSSFAGIYIFLTRFLLSEN